MHPNLFNKVTLTFNNPNLEKEYLSYFIDNFLPNIKLAVIFGIILYLLFSFLDIILFPDLKYFLIGIRIKYVLPALIILYFLLNHKKYVKYIHSLIAISVLISGYGIIYMIKIIDINGYENNIYFVGLILVGIFSYTFFRLKFLYALITGMLIILGYEVVAIVDNIPVKTLIGNNFFFITAHLIGMIVSYIFDLNSRKFFLIQREMEKEKINLVEDKIRFEKLAHLDSLTEIPNKRFFMETLEHYWKEHLNKETLSLLIIDVDFFKNYNDFYGHIAGDKCLIKIAKTIENLTRRYKDIVARFGGEEFVVLLPYTDSLKSISIANRIKDKVYNLKIPHKTSSVANFITVSIGVASIKPTDNNYESILIKADKALYKAKRDGRNKVSFYV